MAQFSCLEQWSGQHAQDLCQFGSVVKEHGRTMRDMKLQLDAIRCYPPTQPGYKKGFIDLFVLAVLPTAPGVLALERLRFPRLSQHVQRKWDASPLGSS